MENLNLNEEQPLVSVVITTYSRPENLIRAIKSVLEQTYKNIELIVVDDNGKGTEYQKQTYDLIKGYVADGSVKYIPHEVNKNGSAARNTGWKNSRGKYVAFLDDDDEFLSSKIERQISSLIRTDDSCGGAYCRTRFYYRDRIVDTAENKSGKIGEDMLLGRAPFNTSTLLLKRSVLEQLNGFDESFRRQQDWELLLRFFRSYNLQLVDEILVNRHCESGDGAPCAAKLYPIRNQFFEIFKKDIDGMTLKAEIYYTHYMGLTILLIKERQYKTAVKSYYKATTYCRVKKGDAFAIIRSLVKSIIGIK